MPESPRWLPRLSRSTVLTILSCGGTADPPREPTVRGENLVELLLTAPTMTASAPPPVVSPPSAPSPPADHRFAAMLTVGNQWRYRVVDAWHSSNRGTWIQTETVHHVERVGRYWVAQVTIDGGARLPKLWIMNDEELWVFSDEKTLPKTEEDLQGMLESEPTFNAKKGSRARIGCTPAGCFEVQESERDFSTDRTWFRPGMGLVSFTDGWYSVDTGDGGARHAFLVGFEGAAKLRPADIADEPKDAREARLRVHQAAKAGRLPRLDDVDPHVMFSLNGEHMSRDAAFESWKASASLVKSALVATLSEPCKLVVDHEAFLACPAAFADTLATGAKASSGASEKPRAVFTKSDAGWRLATLLLGGQDDVFSKPEWSAHPPLPLSLQDRFQTATMKRP